MKRTGPELTTDAEAEAFLDQDLSNFDFRQFKPAGFDFERKAAQLDMRVPQLLLDAVKNRAKARGIPYTRYIRELMQRDISRSSLGRLVMLVFPSGNVGPSLAFSPDPPYKPRFSRGDRLSAPLHERCAEYGHGRAVDPEKLA